MPASRPVFVWLAALCLSGDLYAGERGPALASLAPGASPAVADNRHDWDNPIDDLHLAALRGVVPDATSLISTYDDQRDTGMHRAVDIKAPRGAAVLSLAPGRVTGAGEQELAGLWVDVEHAPGVVTRYLHFDRILVSIGQQVSLGQAIGVVGDTGNARTTTPHLHLEVLIDGRRIDPLPVLVVLEEYSVEAALEEATRIRGRDDMFGLQPSIGTW